MRNLTTLFAILAISLLITGCPDSGGTGAGTNDNDNDSMMNDNDNDSALNDNDNVDGGAGTVTLDTLTFGDGNVPVGEGPITYEIGGGSVTFENGDSGTRSIPPLYGEGAFSWNVDPDDSPSTITFTNLQVVAINFYFAQTGATGGIVTALDSDGNAIGAPIASVATVTLGDPNGFLDLVASDGVTIASLTITFNEGVGDGEILAVDSISLTVVE